MRKSLYRCISSRDLKATAFPPRLHLGCAESVGFIHSLSEVPSCPDLLPLPQSRPPSSFSQALLCPHRGLLCLHGCSWSSRAREQRQEGRLGSADEDWGQENPLNHWAREWGNLEVVRSSKTNSWRPQVGTGL